jgi:hypothetical protein
VKGRAELAAKVYDVATRSNELPASAAQKHELKKQNKTKSDAGGGGEGIGRDWGGFFFWDKFCRFFLGEL